jgi:hypothetical protein
VSCVVQLEIVLGDTMWKRLQSLLLGANRSSDPSGQGESFAQGRLRLVVADITTLQVDAIVLLLPRGGWPGLSATIVGAKS